MFRSKTILAIMLLCACLNTSALAAENDSAPSAAVAREVNLTYPRIDGLGEAGDKMTRTIANEIDAFAEIFRKYEYSGQVGYKVKYNHSPLLSVTLDEMYYMYHAAHPMSYLRAYTFDTRTGKILQLADLFSKDADYRSRLNKFITDKIAEDNIPLLNASAVPAIKPEQEFYLSRDALVIYYQRYEFTSYAQGFLKFSVPYKQIADLLNPEFAPMLTTEHKPDCQLCSP